VTRALEITVDHDLCVGNAQCVGVAPLVFRHNADRQSEVIDPGAASEALVVRAAVLCPTGAIQVVDEATGRVLAP
jgi:ferredoxin